MEYMNVLNVLCTIAYAIYLTTSSMSGGRNVDNALPDHPYFLCRLGGTEPAPISPLATISTSSSARAAATVSLISLSSFT